jgi:pimeloyl-ACP methyl ester carboxylesterase
MTFATRSMRWQVYIAFRLTALFGFFLSVMAAIDCVANADTGVDRSYPPRVENPSQISPACGKGQISLAPNGQMALIWDTAAQRLPYGYGTTLRAERAALIDLNCAFKASDLANCWRAEVVNAPHMFSSVYWSASSKSLFVIDGASRLSHFRLGASGRPQLMGAELIGAPVVRDRFRVLGASSENALRDELKRLHALVGQVARVERTSLLNGKRIRRAYGTLAASGSLGISVQSMDDLMLGAALNNAAPTPLGVASPSIMAPGLPYVAVDAYDRPYLVGGADILPIHKAAQPNTPPAPSAPVYARPIHDAPSGRLIGWHSEADVFLPGYPDIKRLIEDRLTTDKQSGWKLWGAQIAGDRRVGAALLQNSSGLLRYVFFRFEPANGRWSQVELACGPIWTKKLNSKAIELGDLKRPLPAILYRSVATRKLLLYLHGGPEGGLGYDRQVLGAKMYVDEGYDVISVDPSGTVGVRLDVATRLRQFGESALEIDAKLLGDYVRGVAARYDKVDIVAESFGGVFAPFVVRELGDRISRVALIAPLLTLERQELSVGAGELVSDVQYQRMVETAWFGEATVFNSWLTKRHVQMPEKAKTIIVFGALDTLSSAKSLREPNSYGRLLVVPGGHISALRGAESTAAVRSWLRNQ